MTVYPQTGDRLSALTRAGGITERHAIDHGRIIGLWENVKHYGAVGDGTTDDTAAFQAAIDAGFRVYVPAPPSHYVISNKLTVSNSAGLHMTGSFNKGSWSRIKCNNFPANTDVFQLTGSGFPQLQLEDLFFDWDSGTKPRDLYRETVTDAHGIKWRNLYIQNMGGYGFNVPAGLETVAPRFEDVNIIGCGVGGMYFARATAAVLRNCRFSNVGASSGIDLEIAGGAGYTIDSPVFDGISPGSANFTRCKISGTLGVTIIQPYMEWASTSASGTLRNIHFAAGAGNSGHTVIGGVGQVTPIGGGYTLTPIEIDTAGHVLLLNPPLDTWIGAGPYALKVISSSGVISFTAATKAQTSVDATSAQSARIYSNGSLIRYSAAGATTLSGTTDDCEGASFALVSNGSGTNMNQMTGNTGDGHFITLVATNGNTQLINAGIGTNYFQLRGGVNHTMATNEAISFVYQSGGGGQWMEIGR